MDEGTAFGAGPELALVMCMESPGYRFCRYPIDMTVVHAIWANGTPELKKCCIGIFSPQ
jgi:hypothetical protein